VVVAAATFAAVSSVSNLAGPAAEKYQGLLGGNEAKTVGKRNFLIEDGVDLALAYPMGRGAGGYQFETQFGYPHNAFVEIASEQGVIGLALLLALMVTAFRASLRAREGPFSPESILTGGLLIVLVTDAMVSQTFTQFRELWFALGLALAVPHIGAGAARAREPG
jgi:O-antigen ligase/polysaccharide polymerase Wzy-like membrane protein